jgi:uncharacterized phiE125 gp8 family phage protein
MSIKLIIPPAVKPLLVSDVGSQVRNDLSEENVLVELYIAAVTAKAEAYIKRALITQTWELSLDMFPLSCTLSGRMSQIKLPMAPVQNVISIKYVDSNGDIQTVAPSDYILTDDDPNTLVPVYGKYWPATRIQPGAVKIQYVAGFGDQAENIPEAIRAWMLLNVANLYENRETVTVGPRAQMVELTTMADSLLDSYRLVQF